MFVPAIIVQNGAGLTDFEHRLKVMVRSSGRGEPHGVTEGVREIIRFCS